MPETPARWARSPPSSAPAPGSTPCRGTSPTRTTAPPWRPRRRPSRTASDAAVEAYPGWGGYGGAKAALDHTSAVLAAEHPGLRVYAADPGDMRTDMHQRAFPGEDISDRPEPETVVPARRRLIASDRPNGRYEATALLGVPA